jgi:hypothetical protein
LLPHFKNCHSHHSINNVLEEAQPPNPVLQKQSNR